MIVPNRFGTLALLPGTDSMPGLLNVMKAAKVAHVTGIKQV